LLKVSIITISYNSSETILQTLESVKDQNYMNFEHIIIDGNSNDETLEICKKFNHISKIISENDSGVYNAFNKGLKVASGDVIGFLNSDDTFADKESLKKIVDAFDSETDAVFGNLKFYNKKNKVVRKWVSKSFSDGAFKNGWMPPHPTFYCKKKIYDKLGNYDDSYSIAGDFELMLRFIQVNKIRTKFINKNLIKMQSGGISNSGLLSKIKILIEEFKAFDTNNIRINKFFYVFNKVKKIKEFL
tara:strand:- start:147 stop:881 length:735 start_codon:yes stop_codon:yes gene_type:complete